MNKNIIIALALTMLSPMLLFAQESKELIPLDKSIRTGKLPNGFTYYIKKNTTPGKRLVMYLVNKVGSILENDSQQGLAHFMEHMCFNGTKHFPKNELVNYLQKSGVRFGADLNAYTSFDETVYQLPLASDNPELIKNGLQILRDWAQDATLEQSQIDAERGVVLEEKRLRLGSAERINKKIFPLLVNNAKYASRSPIGEEGILKNFTRDTLMAFYKDWYRPDLQAIIIVGDIDVNKIEVSVKNIFGDLKMPENPKPRQANSIPLLNKNQFGIFTDKDVNSSNVQIIIKSRLENIKSKNGFRQILMRSIFNQLVGARLAELSQNMTLPFLNVSASFETVLADLQAFNVDIKIKKSDFENGVKAVWGLLQNIKQNGFTKTEIERTRISLMALMQSQLEQADKSNSEELVQEYVRNFLTGEPVPGIAIEYSMAKDFFADLKTDDFNAFASSCIGNANRDIYITAPEKDIKILPDEATMEGWLLQASQKMTAVSNAKEIIPQLITKNIKPGSVISEKKNKITGVTEWLLSNGATVLLKPTKFANNEILFGAASTGGASLVNANQYPAIMSSADIIPASGVGNYKPLELRKILNGKLITYTPFINDYDEGFTGGSTVNDVESALQLMHLSFTQPRIDSSVLNNFLEQVENQINTRDNNPNTSFGDTVTAVLGNYCERNTPPSLQKLNQLRLNDLLKLFRERFDNASDFHFVFAGNINLVTFKLLVEKYIASLPSSKIKEQPKDVGCLIPEGRILKVVNKGTEDKASVLMVYSGRYDYSDANNLEIKMTAEILQLKLLARLREKEGGVYSPNAYAEFQKLPAGQYTINVAFDCAPANVDSLIKSAEEEIQSLIKYGATEFEILKFTSGQKSLNAQQMQSNGFWVPYLANHYAYNQDPEYIFSYDKQLKAITGKTTKSAAAKYLSGKNYIEFIHLPGL